MKISILDVPFDQVTQTEALNRLQSYLKLEKNHLLVTPNPEIVMTAQTDPDLMRILKQADLVVPDGIGIIIGSKIQRKGLNERVPGCDLLLSLFESPGKEQLTVYLLGSKPGVTDIAKARIEEKYPLVQVIGHHHGYFDKSLEQQIIEDIKRLKPEVLVVGLGCPKQEKWIDAYQHELPVKISAGLGGSIDSIAGTVPRAPRLVQVLALEWLFRAVLEPKRFKRLLKIPSFLFMVVLTKR